MKKNQIKIPLSNMSQTSINIIPIGNSTFEPVEIDQPGTYKWLWSFRSITEIIHDEPTFLLCELEFYMLCILTYIHAHRHGGRYYWLWWTTILHGLSTECISYWYEDIDNFWHAQSLWMWFGKREPFHIICLYPGFIYTATVAVSRLNIVENARPFAAGLGEVLMDFPYDVMGIKLLWWTWHDTDTNIYDRTYSVPWTSYFFHMSFGMAFTFLLQRSRRYFTGLSGIYSNDEIEAMPFRKKQLANNWKGELAIMCVVGMFSFPLGVFLQFVPLYHIPHDIFGIHTEVCVMLLIFLYGSITFWGILRARPNNLREIGEREVKRHAKQRGPGKWHVDETYIAVIFHYMFYICIVIFSNPQNVRATGLHQHVAPPGCRSPLVLNESVGILGLPDTPNEKYPFIGDITRRKYYDPSNNIVTKITLRYGPYEVLPWPGRKIEVERNHTICPSNFSEPTQEFYCTKEQQCRNNNNAIINTCTMPKPGTEWYTLCGTSYIDVETGRNTYAEYVMMVCGVCFLGMYVFTAILAYPRTLFDIVFDCQLPKYYKIHGHPGINGSIKRILKRKKIIEVEIDENRVTDGIIAAGGNQQNQEAIYLIEREDGKTEWKSKSTLVSDGIGATYGERGGLYGLNGIHGETSTRERLRTFDAYNHALERIKMWKKKDI